MEMIPSDVRSELLDRRARLESVVRRGADAPQLEHLLHEIDRALDRFANGAFGRCETCGDAIEPDLLQADPLVRFCLDHLDAAQSRALEQDLELAARVQRNLLPSAETRADGWHVTYYYQPLTTVSGDYVDLVRPSGDSDLFFLFGDIAGKGVAASMLMAHLHASVRTLIDLGLPLSQVLERANRVFCESTMANHYATLVCGRLSPGGALELANAGHCPPMLIHEGRITTVDATSIPLGLFCANQYPPACIQLVPGDTLLLYTDGLSEASNREDEQYGVERLSAVALANAAATPADLVSACVRDVAAFRGPAPRLDDATMMAIRRT